MPKDYQAIKTGVIGEIKKVRLYDETLDHIREEHPEVPIDLPSLTNAVKKAIQEPTHVEKSYSNSYVFVDATSTNASGDPLRVPVKRIDGTTSGRVKTVYFASTSGSHEEIWRRDDD